MNPDESEHRLSRATASRLSLYLRCLSMWQRDGIARVSSGVIAETLGLNDTQVRRDLASIGSLGRPGIGYPLSELIEAIREVLGVNRSWKTILVGVGNLARALLRYRGFQEQGFDIVALFDSDPAKVGTAVGSLAIRAMTELPETARTCHAEIGILTVPADFAQSAADAMAEVGIRGILNFAPVILRLPETIRCVNVDLTIQLEQLAFQIVRD